MREQVRGADFSDGTQSQEITLDGPVEQVFDFMADVDNERGWNPELRFVARAGGGRRRWVPSLPQPIYAWTGVRISCRATS
jgi:hypothetical protein